MFSLLPTGGPPPMRRNTFFQSGGMYFRSTQSAGQPSSMFARTSSSHSLTETARGAPRQAAIRPEVLRRTIDLARFLVVLNPAKKRLSWGHRGLGADFPELLSEDELPTDLDADLPIVCYRPVMSGQILLSYAVTSQTPILQVHKGDRRNCLRLRAFSKRPDWISIKRWTARL